MGNNFVHQPRCRVSHRYHTVVVEGTCQSELIITVQGSGAIK